MSYSTEVLADSPLAYYRLNETGSVAISAITASTSFSSEPPANAFDGDGATFWTTNGVSSGWLRVQLAGANATTGYSIRRRDDIPSRNPKTWTFEGSHDGSAWDVLDTRADITWGTAAETKTFTFANTTAYTYYRLNVSANGGDTYLSVAELGIVGVGAVPMFDSSGNGRDGVYSGGQTAGATGALVGDADFAVTFSGDDYATVPYAAWMEPGAAFTLEAWIKTTATGLHSILDRDSGSRSWQFRHNGGTLEFVKIAGGVTTVSAAGTINDGAWHHVGVTHTGSTVTMYVDGTTVQSQAVDTLSATTAPFRIGVNNGGSLNAFFVGDVDEVAYYGTALSSARIAAHYAAGTTAPSDVITIAGESWASPSSMLDGLAKLGLRVIGESWAAPATMLDGTIPVTVPVVVSGDAWTAPATLLDGTPTLGPLVVTGEAWSVPAEWVEGFFPGQPVVVVGESWSVPGILLDGAVPQRFATVTADKVNGRQRSGRLNLRIVNPLDVDATDEGVPAADGSTVRLHKQPYRIISPSLPAPTLVDGRPQ